jgi:hypothetical protein
MAQYLLTQEDIDRLQLVDALPDDPATDEEMIKLGIKPANTAPDGSPIVPPDVPVEQQVTGTPAPITTPAPAPADGAQTPYSMNDLMAALQGVQGLQAGQETQDDPYGKLSKTQRRMLAFAAISDAGRALQGKEGTMVTSLLGDFTDRADQARKAKATTQARAMMGMVAQNMQAIEDPRERLELLNNYLVQGVIDPTVYSAMAGQITTQIQNQKLAASSVEGAASTLDTVGDLRDALRENPGLTTGPVGWALGKLPFGPAAEAQNLVATLRSNMALNALKELKKVAGGIGAISNTEMQLLEDEITRLDLAVGYDESMDALDKIQKRYRRMIINAYNDPDVNAEELNKILGGRPQWTLDNQDQGGDGSIVPNEEDL